MSKHLKNNELYDRDSFNIINNSSTAHIESLDFEELESVMWRKVLYNISNITYQCI